MKRLGMAILILYAAVVTGVAASSLARGQAAGVSYIVLDADYTWHYAEDIEITPGGVTETPAPQTPATPVPTVIPADPKCYGVVSEGPLRVRDAPWGAVIGAVQADDTLTLQAYTMDGDGGKWYQIYWLPGQDGYVYASLVKIKEDADCSRLAPTNTAWGVWSGPGSSRDELINFGRALMSKGIVPAATVYGDGITASTLYDAGWVVAWRPFTGLNCPVFDSPPEQNARDWWRRTLDASQGVLFTWLVVCNEPVFPDVGYAARWIGETVRLAERDGVARVVPVVWSPGSS